MENVEWTREFLRNIAPRGAACSLVPPLEADESRWFREAIEHCVFSVGECRSDCPRRRRHNEVTQDEFLTPTGQHRHLFSISKRYPVRMNREYVPHIAAVARAIIHFGFPAERYALSFHRRFQRDCVTKKAGQSYESDAEFYAADGSVDLHVEAKKTLEEVRYIANTIQGCGTFTDLPVDCKKELEYVLDLSPKHLWLVAPGCIEPERYVYAVRVQGSQVEFRQVSGLASLRAASNKTLQPPIRAPR